MPHDTILGEKLASIPSTKASGYILGAAAVLMAVFILMHPTVDAHGMDEFRAGVERVAVQNAVVHGSLIVVQAFILVGLLGLCDLLGMTPGPVVRLALIVYAMGAVGASSAAVINGFVVPSMMSHAQDVEALRPVISLCHHASRMLTEGGVIALSCGAVIWSVTMLRTARVAGVMGIVCGVGAIVAMMSGHLSMTVHGLGSFIVALAVWHVAVAWRLGRG